MRVSHNDRDLGEGMKRLLILLIALSAMSAHAQSPKGSGLSASEIVERLWKQATEGELLTSDGRSQASRLFVQPLTFPNDSTFRVISNDWGIGRTSMSSNNAEVVVEYWNAGTVDASLHYAPPEKTEFYKNAEVFHLVFAPTHWTMFKSDGKSIIGKEERLGPSEWQIKDKPEMPWTTVNTAIRWVVERREKTTDPTIRKNADETLTQLLKLH